MLSPYLVNADPTPLDVEARRTRARSALLVALDVMTDAEVASLAESQRERATRAEADGDPHFAQALLRAAEIFDEALAARSRATEAA